VESDQWVAFRSWAGFDAFYCQPGIGGAHEKGGVEGEGGRFRRTHLVPVPKVATLAERPYQSTRGVSDRPAWNGSAGSGRSSAASAAKSIPTVVGRWIMVRQCHYSVPVRYIGRRVRARLGASELLVFDGRTEIARHARSVRKGSQTLTLDHYLEVLVWKPVALPGSVPLVQARADGRFTAAHDAFWAGARKAARRRRRHPRVRSRAAAAPAPDARRPGRRAHRGGRGGRDQRGRGRRRGPQGRRPARRQHAGPVRAGRTVAAGAGRQPDRTAAVGLAGGRSLPTVDQYDELLRGGGQAGG